MTAGGPVREERRKAPRNDAILQRHSDALNHGESDKSHGGAELQVHAPRDYSICIVFNVEEFACHE